MRRLGNAIVQYQTTGKVPLKLLETMGTLVNNLILFSWSTSLMLHFGFLRNSRLNLVQNKTTSNAATEAQDLAWSCAEAVQRGINK